MSRLDMQVQERRLMQRFDWNLALVILALNLIGLINLYSATHGVTLSVNTRLFWQQLFWLGAGWVVYFAVTLTDYQLFVRLAYVIYILNLAAICAVMVVGKSFYGSQRWLDLGFFAYQPSETMKLAIVLALTRILAKRPSLEPLGYRGLLLPALVTLVPFALTVKQPDLGTALLMLTIFVSLMLFVGVKISVLSAALVSMLVAVPLVWNFGLKDYQKNRVLTFITPGTDPRGAGYNSIQSKIAVGSGRILGKGFRKGSQSQLEFIPERHSDFIFSVLSEEHGFIGSVTTLGLFVVLLFMGIRIASQARDRWGALIVVGVLSILFWHMFINMGMVIGIMPIVGVPLPLLSYGGSSMITTMFGLGLISSVAYRKYLF